MLAIRMKRTGRRGHAQYRVVVQDSRLSPSSGRVVAYLGSYNPHTKATTLDKEKASGFLVNGAHPSDRVAKLLKKEGVDLPKWVKISSDKQRNIKNPAKLRKNQPKEEVSAEQPKPEAPAPEPITKDVAEDAAKVSDENEETTEPEVEPDAEAKTTEEPAA